MGGGGAATSAGDLPADALLVIRFSSLGDVILATAAATRLRRGLPGRPIVFVTRAAWAPLLLHHPDIDRIVTLEDAGGGGLSQLTRTLARVHWAGLLDLHGSLRSRWLAARLRARARVRYDSRRAARRLLVLAPPLAHRLGLDREWQVVDAQVAAAERLIERIERRAAARRPGLRGDTPANPSRPLTTLGAAPDSRPAVTAAPAIHLSAEERLWAAAEWERLELPVGAVGLCPGARHATKRWPVESYAAVADRLAESGQRGIPVFLSDEPDDREIESRLRAAAGVATRLVTIRRPLRKAAALLARCRTIITNDSGLMHLAAAVGVPVVALFGPTVGAFGFRPCGRGHRVLEIDLDCRPCSLHGGPVCPQRHFRCLREIRPEDVLAALPRWGGAPGPISDSDLTGSSSTDSGKPEGNST